VKPAELALVDFEYFIERYMNYRLWKWQRRLAADTQAAIDSDLFFNYQFLGPADSGKSSRIVVPLILWLLARDRNNRIILVGNKDSYIEQISQAAMRRIELTEALQKDFGLRRGNGTWAVDSWYIERPDVHERAPSVLAVGAGSEIQSQRADFVIGDDVLTRRNSRTASQREALNSYLTTDVDSRVDKTKRPLGKGKTLLYGHRVEANDGYKLREDWTDGVDRFITKKYPAIINDATKEILVPEATTYDQLASHRSRDLLGFMLMQQQESAQMGIFITQTSMERCREPNLHFFQTHKQLAIGDKGDFKFTWMSLDPAFSQNRWSSHAVMQWWGMKQDGRRQLLWGYREKTSPESLLNLIESQFRLKMPDHFLIETNQAQVLLLPFLRKKFPDHTTKFKGVYTHDNDDDLQASIVRLFDLYSDETPKKIIPFGGVTEQAFALAMTNEFCAYPEGKRDTIMCDWVGEKGLGLIKEETRSGHRTARGIMGQVAQRYSQSYISSPWWRR
jgi:hypothetical protein